LLTFNILDRAKTDRLMALSRRLKRLAVVFDNDVVARGLSEAAVAHGGEVPFLVECDTGFGRWPPAEPCAEGCVVLKTAESGRNDPRPSSH
jgi:D-serine deaminase-like pyridoxal phosphate-dependent protein